MTSDSAGRRRRRTPLRLIAPSRAAGGDVPDFRLMVEESLSILILMDAEGRIEYTNRLFAEVTGYAPSEVAGRRIHELGDVTPEQAAEIWAAVGGARPWRGEFRGTKKTGQSYWVDLSIRHLGEAGRGSQRFLAVALDITEHKRAEEALRASETNFRALAETLTVAIFIADGVETLYANPAAQLLTGYSREELLARLPRELVHPDSLPALAGLVSNYQSDPDAPLHTELRMRTKSGQERWVDFSGSFLEYQGRKALLGTAFDITDRRRSAEALRQSEARLRAFANAVPDIAFILDEDGRYVEVLASPQREPLLYSEAESLKGRLLHDILPSESADLFLAVIQKTIETREPQVLEYTLQVPAGDEWFEGRTAPLPPLSGKPMVVWLAYDITARKRAELALREKQEQLQTLLYSAPIVLFAFDRDGRFVLSEGKGLAWLGRDPGSVVGLPIREVHPNTPKIYDNFQRALSGQVVVDELEVGGRWWTASSAPLRAPDGEITGVIGVALDITERRRAEEGLRQSEERYRDLYQQNPSMYFTVAEDGTVLSVNDFGAAQLGYSPQELVGRPVLEIFHKADRAAVKRQFAYLAHEPAQVRSWEFRKVRKDGRVIWVKELVRAARDSEGNLMFLVVCDDISEHKQMEQTLQLLREELERKAERAVGLRNPYALSFREMTVLHLLASGKSDKEISTVLGIRPFTVSKHVGNILKKMGAASRTEAGVRAWRDGLVTDGDETGA